MQKPLNWSDLSFCEKKEVVELFAFRILFRFDTTENISRIKWDIKYKTLRKVKFIYTRQSGPYRWLKFFLYYNGGQCNTEDMCLWKWLETELGCLIKQTQLIFPSRGEKHQETQFTVANKTFQHLHFLFLEYCLKYNRIMKTIAH